MTLRGWNILIVIGALLLAPAAYSYNFGFAKEDAGHPGSFLDYAASARSLGMGNAFTGVADDAGATYWNPAGLTQLERKNLVSLYSALDEDTSYGTISFGQPTLDYGTYGVGLVTLRSGNFDKRSDTGASMGAFDQSDFAILLSQGFEAMGRLSFGSTLKVISENIDTYSGTGYGADVGMMATFNSKVQAGLVLRNIWAPKLKLRSETEKYPQDFRLGIKFQPKDNLILTTDLDKTYQRSLKPYFGAEYKLNHLLALRTGLNETEITAGLGIKLRDLSLDYAFGYNQPVAGVTNLGAFHRIGFNWSFGQKIAEEGGSVRWQQKGQLVLNSFRDQMNSSHNSGAEIEQLVETAREVVAHQGYSKAADLYAAQGYISYFSGEYERSVQSFGEALNINPKDNTLAKHLQKAKRQMTEDQAKRLIKEEMKLAKEFFDKGNYFAAVASCKNVLAIAPDHVEASAYLEDAQKRINEPILRELKIAKTKFEREEYLDAIKHLQEVKQMDPKNEEADKLMATSIAALEKISSLQYKTLAASQKAKVYELQSDSSRSRALYSQGLMLYSTGKLKEAVAVWEKAVSFDGDNQLARNAFNRGMAELQEAKTR